MNKLIIIGNLTRDPETRTTADGRSVTNFTVAVNRRTNREHPVADYIRVSVWDRLGENCAKYLAKGKKVCVSGPVRAAAYMGQDGSAKASLEMTGADVEFLSPRDEAGMEGSADAPGEQMDPATGNTVVDAEDLPF